MAIPRKKTPRGLTAAAGDRSTAAWLGLLAVLLAFVSYLPALSNGFVWDDPLVLRQLRAFDGLSDLLVMPPEVPRYYYRPVVFATYLLDRLIAGEVPFWFHLSVVLVHCLNTWLVFRLALLLFNGSILSAVTGAALFAVLPVHAESVAWMAGRSDVIACAFLLLTALCFAQDRGGWRIWGGGLCFFLALLAKESAIAGLALVPAFDWLRRQRLRPVRYVPLALATLVYFALRVGNSGTLALGTSAALPLDEALIRILGAVGYYALRSVAPVGVMPLMPEVPVDVGHLAAGAAALAGTLVVAYRRWPRFGSPVGYLLAWYWLTLAPSLVVILRVSASTPIADRYLYVPSVAVCLLLASILAGLVQRKRVAAVWAYSMAGVVVLLLALNTAASASLWRDNYTFWAAVARQNPTNAMAQRELGAALLLRGDLAGAEAALSAALRLPSDQFGEATAYSSIALIYRRQERFDDAIAALNSALRVTRHPVVYHNLGMTLMVQAESMQKRGDTAGLAEVVRRARDAFEAALATREAARGSSALEQWEPAKTHALLGQVLLSLNDRRGAIEQFEASLRVQPTGQTADVTRRQLARARGAP